MSIRNYVAEVVPYQSAVARDNLIAQGFAVFHPTVIKLVKHPRFQSVAPRDDVPLFSGYVFVSFDPADHRWRIINGTRGVKRLICNGDSPIAMPVGVMEEIQRAHAAGVFDEKEKAAVRLKRGTLAQVISGPFSGFIGECLVSEATRVKLLLSIFGRRTETWLTPDTIAAA